jgi:VWFA-related protein
MQAGRVIGGGALAALVCFGIAVEARQRPASGRDPQQPPATFRSRVTLVPVDVRVVDRNGNPVKDLRQEDFTVSEDGVPQRIVQFSFQELAAAPAVAAEPLAFRKPLGEAIAPQGRRIFLIVLGRGRQAGPVKGVQAAKSFIDTRLLPQDQVAVLAYNRSTDFTSDHARVVETIDRYWQKHEKIEARLKHHFSGLAAQYAKADEIPASIQKEIDEIFRAPGALASRSVASTRITDGAQIASDTRRNTDRIQRAAEAAERKESGIPSPFDDTLIDEAGLLDMPFDEYVEKSSATSQDLGNLYAGIRYLRYLDGEKHLVFLTPEGLFLPRLENSNSIAALANDARVTVDIIHTGGMAGGAPMRPLPAVISARGAAAIGLNSAVPSSSVIFNQTFSIGSSKQVADLTGGLMGAMTSAEKLFKRLDDTTRAQYLLGYSPANGDWNGAYRKIRVTVNRPGLTVLYRHGYAARLEIKPLNRKDYLTYSRIASAINRPQPIDDLKVTLPGLATPAPNTIHLTVHLAADGITFTRDGEHYVAQLDCAYFVGDKREALAGELWRTLDFKITEANYQKFLREGVTYTQAIEYRGEPKYAKVVIYQYAADLVGSAVAMIKQP